MQNKTIVLLSFYLLIHSAVYTQTNKFSDIKAFELKNSVWRSGDISVCWENPSEDDGYLRDTVRYAISNTWELHSAVRFTGWGECSDSLPSDIQIRIADEVPHTVDLGKKIQEVPGGMVLNFAFRNWCWQCGRGDKIGNIQKIAIHEFGHALGLAHEQNRYDCAFENCSEDDHQGQTGDWYINACDPLSVMNYCNKKWINNGVLSDLDIEAVRSLYGPPPGTDSTDLRIVNTSFLDKDTFVARINGHRKVVPLYNVKIYLSGDRSLMDSVDHVEYFLHESLVNPIFDASNARSNFGIHLRLYGTFKLKAWVYFKDQSKKMLTHDVKINFIKDTEKFNKDQLRIRN